MARFQTFQIVRDGRPYNAAWHVEGRQLVVSGAYGSLSRPLGRGRPERLAERLLAELVDARTRT